MFPVEKYRYYIDKDAGVVVAVSTFAGKHYKGVARCAPGDEFNLDTGKRLAAARCGVKISSARVDYASSKRDFEYRAFDLAKHLRDDADEYLDSALKELNDEKENLFKVLESLS